MRLSRGRVEFAAVARLLACMVLVCESVHAGLPERLAVQRLGSTLPRSASLVVHPGTGAIEAIRGFDLLLSGAASERGASVRAWILEHAVAFGLDPGADDIVVERDEALPGGGRRILLRQIWHGYPVEAGDARCVISASGWLKSVAAGFRSAISAPTLAAVGREDVVARAASGGRARLEREAPDAALWVRRHDGVDRLAWRVGVPLADGRRAIDWIDAASGQVLARDDGCARAVGRVFPTDPRQPTAEVPLDRLLPGVGLVSRWFGVEDQLYPPVTPIGPGDDYRFDPSQPGFDQVNAYWHCDRFLHEFVGALGYAGPPESLIVRVNAPLDPGVALTSGRYVYFGRPVAGFSLEAARCHDIIYHELTHAVLYGAGVLPGGDRREAGALHEALADYYAAALTGDAGIGEWLYLPFPLGATRVDQPMDPWHARNYDRLSFGGAPPTSVWANGMILSAALWDLRLDLGSTCDSLVLESLTYLPSVPTWAQFANALLQADQDHHGGRRRDAIVQVLSARGIRGAAVAGIAGPTTLAPGETGDFLAVPCCGGALATYHWRTRAWCRGVPCGEWQDRGAGPELRLAFEEDSELVLEVTSPWGERVTATRLVGVRPPELLVDGPRRIVQHGPGTWTARAVGMGPLRVIWQRQWRRVGAPLLYLGEGLAQSFAADTSCDLTVSLFDGLNRLTRQNIAVVTFADRPPGIAPSGFRVSQRTDARARGVETTVELTRATRLSMVVYDIRGRVRARLWEGPATTGAHVVRWNAASLEPGVYLLRVLAEPHGSVLRFSVVR